MRLDKYLADCSVGTRSECKNYIKQGRIIVNESVIKDASFHVNDSDMIMYDHNELKLYKELYFMFHKPQGCICATQDDNDKTVLDYFPAEIRKHLVIVGRLDKDTEGLLLLTDDGSFVHKLMSPKKHVNKTYYFEAEGTLVANSCELVKNGIDIGDDALTKPGVLIIESEEHHLYKGYLTISEGRYHQVKRMLQKLGAEVTYLKRISIGNLMLDDTLKPGEYRELSKEEREHI